MHAGRLSRSALILLALSLTSCRRDAPKPLLFSGADSLRVHKEIAAYRAERDSFFRYDPASPFNLDSSAVFHALRYFPPDLRFCFRSPLIRSERPETVTVYGTGGEARLEVAYGYFPISFGDRPYRLNAYKTVWRDPAERARHSRELSVWFTDETTGRETYEVGRYVEAGQEQPSADALYTINLNFAYNPYCAYSSRYSCAIPRKEDHLPLRVTAGEMKYHE